MSAPGRLHSFALANGLRVLLCEDHRLPLVAVHLAYRVGAADEAEGQHGLAHLFEHLMYGGSENLPGTYLSHLFAAGAHDLNGRTIHDSTHYFETVHRDALDFALFAEADRMGRLVLSERTLEKQRLVVLNELRQYRERSRGGFVERIDAECFEPGHPYRHGVIGVEADLQALSLDQARQFRQRHYQPANAVLALAGDLTLDEARRRCEREFGRLPAGEQTQRPSAAPFVVCVHRFDDALPKPQRRFVWQLPAMPSMLDREGLRLFQLALESRLRAALPAGSIQPRLGLECLRLATRFTLEWNAPDEASLVRSFEAFEALWARLIAQGFTADEAQQARRLRWRQRLLNLDARSGIAALMIEGELGQGDPASAFFSQRQIEAIDPTAIMQRWFAKERWLTPSANPPCESRKSPVGWVSAKARNPPPVSANLENGLQLTLQQRSGAELVSGRLLLSAGFAAEPAGQMGLAQLCAEASLNDTSLRQQAEVIGCEIGIETFSDRLRLHWSVPLAQWRNAIALVARLLHLSLDPAAFAATQSRQLAAISLASASAEAATQRVLPALLWNASQPRARIASGLRSTIAALSLDQAIAFKRSAWSLRDAQCVLVGDLALDEVTEVLSTWKANADTQTTIVEAASPNAPCEVVHLLDMPQAQQTLLTVAWALPVPSLQTEPALRAFDLLLAGSFSSRLNLRLREELGWTYGVRSRLGDIAAARRYEIQVWVPVEHSLDALDEILRAIAAFQRDGIEMQALAQLQRGEALRSVGRSERVEDAAREIESRLRLGFGSQQELDLSAVMPEQIQQIANLLDTRKAISVFAGDACRLRESLQGAGLKLRTLDGDAEALYALTEAKP